MRLHPRIPRLRGQPSPQPSREQQRLLTWKTATVTVHVANCEMSEPRAPESVIVMPEGHRPRETGVGPMERPAENCDSWLTEK